MKNLFLSLLLFSSFLVKSQISSLGLQAGISSSNFHLQYNEKLNNPYFPEELNLDHASFAFFNVNVVVWKNEYFSLRPSFSLLQKGSEDQFFVQERELTGPFVFRERVRYLTISLDLNTGKDFGKFRPYLVTGIRVDDMFDQMARREKEDYVRTSYDYRNSLFGINTGAGLQYRLSEKFSLQAEYVYRWTVTDLYRPAPTIEDSYFRCETMSLGLVYHLKKRPDIVEPEPAGN